MVVTIKEVFQFVKEVKVEFSKVAWPSLQEFVGSVVVVFVFVAFFLVYLGLVDSIFSKLAKIIFQYGTHFA